MTANFATFYHIFTGYSDSCMYETLMKREAFHPTPSKPPYHNKEQNEARRCGGDGGGGALKASPQQAQSRYGAAYIQQQLHYNCAHQPRVSSSTVQRTNNSCITAAHTSQDFLTEHSIHVPGMIQCSHVAQCLLNKRSIVSLHQQHHKGDCKGLQTRQRSVPARRS